MVDFVRFCVPRLPPAAGVPRQTLRISAGRAAAAAGIHPYTDVGDLFLEFVYQDLPDLLLRDALRTGVEVISPAAERARLMSKSGEMDALEAALRSSAEAAWVGTAREAQQVVARTVLAAESAGRLTSEEATELRRTLELEINLEFGARHEDAAIEAYEAQMKRPVFGQQRRVSMALPEGGHMEALAHTLPPLRREPLPKDEEVAARPSGGSHVVERPETVNLPEGEEQERKAEAYLRLTGFVDGLIDLPRKAGEAGSALQTLVVEVKHRIGKIKDPPNLYDVVQLCCYCRVFGLEKGHLVQCLREQQDHGASGAPCSVGRLHVTDLDFAEGSPDRRGWDDHVLPALYKVADAVYATRGDEAARLRLLSAPSPEARAAVVGELCPHLGR